MLGAPVPDLHQPSTGPAPASSAPGLGSPLPHSHWDRAPPAHICTGTGLASATSAPGRARPRHICTRTGLAPAASATGPGATSAPGLGSPPPHLHRDWARPLPHLHQDRAPPAHICTGTGLTPATSAPALGGARRAGKYKRTVTPYQLPSADDIAKVVRSCALQALGAWSCRVEPETCRAPAPAVRQTSRRPHQLQRRRGSHTLQRRHGPSTFRIVRYTLHV
jgi:hypothetical protein